MSSAATKARPVPFDELPGTSRLFADYLSHPERLAEFFPMGYRREDWSRAADHALTHPRNRELLCDVLREQNVRWDMPEGVLSNIEKLRSGNAVAIVTGQQLGVFGGPLYTIYKTITAVRLAAEMEQETGRPVVPVFWVEGEDHDFAEIAGISLLKHNDVESVRYHRSFDSGNPGAVGRLRLGDEILQAIDQVDEILPPSDFHVEVVELLRRCYSPDRSLEDAFVLLWRELFGKHGLVFLNPDDRRLKEECAPLFRRDLNDSETAVAHVTETGDQLKATYHMQVTARPTNLFYLDDRGRFAIDHSDGEYVLRNGDRRFTREQILAELDRHPERFSPNVVTRPLMQDYLLPTAYYVAGPGEIAYFAQYKGVYQWAEIPMPGIFPRMSATLVEPKVMKVLDRHDLDLPDLCGGVDRLFSELVRRAEGNGVADAFKAFNRDIHRGISALKPEVEAVDPSLGKTVEATRAGVAKEIERLEERVFRAQKRQHDELRVQLEKAAVNLVPHGKLQERVLSPIYYFNKFGLDVIDRLLEDLSLDTTRHQVLEL
jgi:bacillithiol synthase